MFLLTFIIGLGLTSLTASRFTADGGIDQREGGILLIMAILVALGLMFQTLIRITEIRNGVGGMPDPDDETEPEEGGYVRYRPERPDRAPVPPPVSSGAVSIREDPDRKEPEHTLTRTWAPRPDQKIPPAHPDDVAGKTDEPGPAERIMQARERGERT